MREDRAAGWQRLGLGAPFIERLRDNKELTAALTAITAAVVGVILNLAVWFGLHVIFAEVGELNAIGLTLDVPVWSSLNIAAAVLVLVNLVAVVRYGIGPIWVLMDSGCIGLMLAILTV